jgi:hypothetical protein
MTTLSGMKEICDYYKRSEPTILKLIRDEGFPAIKIAGAWESDTDFIDRWRRKQIAKSLGLDVNEPSVS